MNSMNTWNPTFSKSLTAWTRLGGDDICALIIKENLGTMGGSDTAGIFLDASIEEWPEDEIAAVLGHELGHRELHHHTETNRIKEEVEADRYSADLLKEKGYDPRAVIRAMDRTTHNSMAKGYRPSVELAVRAQCLANYLGVSDYITIL